MSTEDCQKVSNKEKETKFNKVTFQNSKLHVLFALWKRYMSSHKCLVFVPRNSAMHKHGVMKHK